jgi:hypothetical protein
MSYAYTPGLKIVKSTLIEKTRLLPVPGEVLVAEGDSVSEDTVISRTLLASGIEMIPLMHILGVEGWEIPKVMLKKEGEFIKEGELLAVSSKLFGLIKNEYYAKISGTVELISVTGMVGIRNPPHPIQRTAYISGKIVEVIENLGAVVRSRGAIIQGILGIGGERHGKLMTIAGSDEVLTPNHLGEDCAGKILVGGSLVTSDFLKKAADEGVVGVIVGGVTRNDLTSFLGYEMGVAITGNENIPLTCIITEGFGNMRMANHTYDLLNSLEGKLASINGATQIRAGVIRPEIIVPEQKTDLPLSVEEKGTLVGGMSRGLRVRVISEPYFGAIGVVDALPSNLQLIETGSQVRVVELTLEDGRRVTVPRANVEIMEE